jgi:uncharacterized protein YjbI with pentapeptide repeats/predicted nucleic acid-binding protein
VTAEQGEDRPAAPALGGLLDGFEGHFHPKAEAWGTALREGVVVLDTNALLDLYRMSDGAREEFLGVLRTLRSRLFVPYQVAHEFHERRAQVIEDRQKEIKDFARQVKGHLDDVRRIVHQHTERARPDPDHVKDLIDAIAAVQHKAQDLSNRVRSEYSLDASKAIRGEDKVLDELVEILDGRVNSRPSDEQRYEDRKEAERRLDLKIPPGFGDADKGPAAVGDYFWWAEVVRYSAAVRRPVLVVTNDVAKKDWMLTRRHIEIGAQPLLVEEIRQASGSPLLLTTVLGLLERSQAELGASVSDSTVLEAKVLREISVQAPLPERGEGETLLRLWKALMNESTSQVWRTQALEYLSDRERTLFLRTLLPRLIDRSESQGRPLQISGLDLSGMDLSGLDLHSSILRDVQLSGANLAGTKLSMATITGNMAGADFSGADLWRATVSGDLTDAILAGANLSEARLLGAEGLTQEQINEANGDTGTDLPPPLRYPAHWPGNTRYPGRER